MTWDVWVHRHARLFGLLHPGEAEMLVELAHVYHGRGLTPDDLAAVSVWLTENDPPSYRGQHIAALDRGIRALRPMARTTQPEAPEGGPPCAICGDPATGWAIVPQTTPGAAQRQAVCVVFCRCALGVWRAKNTGPVSACGGTKRARILTLADYEEVHCPDWRAVLAGWRSATEHERAAIGRAQFLDRTIGAIGRAP